MRRAVIVVGVLAVAVGLAAAEDGKQAVPIKQVVLFSSGVGYFQHEDSVTGDATTELSFKTEQINDILKSLVVMDLGEGTIAAVSYPTKEPLARVLKSFQVDLTANPSLQELMNQLRGAEVKVWAPEVLTGKILGVEVHRRQLPNDQGVIEEAVLNVVCGDGMIQEVPLKTVQKLQLTDPDLASEVDKALAALAAGRDKEKKPIVLSFKGEGERKVLIGYVVETPIWQTSYRLVLGEKDKPLLQGWAIVENTTDSDWTQVQLSLVSGRPISFIQDLYTPLYVPRPVVRPELYASLRPQRYEEGLEEREMLARKTEEKGGAGYGQAGGAMADRARGRRAMAAAPGRAPAEPEGALGYTTELAKRSVESVATAQSVGELFSYDIKTPVTVPRQRSAMLPIAGQEIEGEKVSIYNMNVQAKHPLNGFKLKNTTGLHLMAGPITVFDGGIYAGDAQIDNLPPGDERLLSYALDLDVTVDPSKTSSTTSVLGVGISSGTLVVKRKSTVGRTYLIKNKAEKDKTVIVEHPVSHGYTLIKPENADEKTPALYRFRVKVAAGKTESLEVVEERPYAEQIRLRSASVSQLEYWVKGSDASDAVKAALRKAIALKQEVAELEKQIRDREQRQANITKGQERIRANMGVVDRNSQYYNRLLTQLNEEETELQTLQKEYHDLKKQLDAKQKELDKYLLGLVAE